MIIFQKKKGMPLLTYFCEWEKRELPFLTVVFSVSSEADLQCNKLKNWLWRISYLSACVKTDPVSFNLRRLWKYDYGSFGAGCLWRQNWAGAWGFGADLLSCKTIQDLSTIGCVADLQQSEAGIAQLHLCSGFSVPASMLAVKKPSSHAEKMTGWICPKAGTKAFVHGLAVNKMLR